MSSLCRSEKRRLPYAGADSRRTSRSAMAHTGNALFRLESSPSQKNRAHLSSMGLRLAQPLAGRQAVVQLAVAAQALLLHANLFTQALQLHTITGELGPLTR